MFAVWKDSAKKKRGESVLWVYTSLRPEHKPAVWPNG